jgi:hypothetical protein
MSTTDALKALIRAAVTKVLTDFGQPWIRGGKPVQKIVQEFQIPIISAVDSHDDWDANAGITAIRRGISQWCSHARATCEQVDPRLTLDSPLSMEKAKSVVALGYNCTQPVPDRTAECCATLSQTAYKLDWEMVTTVLLPFYQKVRKMNKGKQSRNWDLRPSEMQHDAVLYRDQVRELYQIEDRPWSSVLRRFDQTTRKHYPAFHGQGSHAIRATKRWAEPEKLSPDDSCWIFRHWEAKWGSTWDPAKILGDPLGHLLAHEGVWRHAIHEVGDAFAFAEIVLTGKSSHFLGLDAVSSGPAQVAMRAGRLDLIRDRHDVASPSFIHPKVRLGMDVAHVLPQQLHGATTAELAKLCSGPLSPMTYNGKVEAVMGSLMRGKRSSNGSWTFENDNKDAMNPYVPVALRRWFREQGINVQDHDRTLAEFQTIAAKIVRAFEGTFGYITDANKIFCDAWDASWERRGMPPVLTRNGQDFQPSSWKNDKLWTADVNGSWVDPQSRDINAVASFQAWMPVRTVSSSVAPSLEWQWDDAQIMEIWVQLMQGRMGYQCFDAGFFRISDRRLAISTYNRACEIHHGITLPDTSVLIKP